MASQAVLTVYRTRSLRRSQRWAWKLTSGVDVIAVSGEGYANLEHARSMALLVTSGGYKSAARVGF
jgi:hypothetical protein